MDSTPSYHKGHLVWWNCAAYNRKPAWIPKGRKEQACVVKAVDLELEQAAIVVFNEERKEEVYMVPLNSIRPRVGI